ncbi:MAG: tetratricopeptide repeat protein [Granulosicoccus sp.]|nr:tetratricopeptide repeat protein [Granulosicoccus sp.]
MAALLLISNCVLIGGCTATSSRLDRQAMHRDFDFAYQQLKVADKAYALGSWQQAILAYKSLIGEIPENAYFHFRLGNALAYDGQYPQAIEALQKSLKIDAHQAKPWLNLSTTHLLAAQSAGTKALASLDETDPLHSSTHERLKLLQELLK